MISSQTNNNTINLSLRSSAIFNLEEQLRFLDNEIAPLKKGKTKKKLDKIEEELKNCNFLINSGLGSKADQAELRKNKRQLRQRRIKIWEELKILPSLKEEKKELEIQLSALRRQAGVEEDT